MTDSPEHGLERARDRFFAPVLRDDDEPQASDRDRVRGRRVTGTGVPTSVPTDTDTDTEARSELEGPPDDDFAPGAQDRRK